jgi:FKBP-type peptidyl-prolyl cis-trans isomerase
MLYRGCLSDGSEFDSNQNRTSPFKFTLGIGQVIAGWDQGVITMKRGEKAVLTITPQYGYGDQAMGDKLPPNSTLVFTVELLDF